MNQTSQQPGLKEKQSHGTHLFPCAYYHFSNLSYRLRVRHQSVIFCGQFNTCLSVSLPAPALRFRSSNLSYLFPALWAIL